MDFYDVEKCIQNLWNDVLFLNAIYLYDSSIYTVL